MRFRTRLRHTNRLSIVAGFLCPEYNESAQVAKLQARLDELEMQNSMAQQQSQQPNEMELLEKVVSVGGAVYGNGNAGNVPPPQVDEKGKRNVQRCRMLPQCRIDVECATNERGFNTCVGMKSRSARIQSPPSLPATSPLPTAVSEVETTETDVDRQQAHTP